MDRRKLMMYALGLFVIGNIWLYPAWLWLVCCSACRYGFGAGMVVVTALTIAAKIAPAGKQGSAIATVVMGFTASLIIGVPLGRMTAEALGWKSVFGGIALLGFIAMIVLFLTLPHTEGDKPVPLLQQLSLLKKRKVAMGLSVTFSGSEDIPLHILICLLTF
ncbi:MFS transporter [Bacillus licheniformis]|nr:MFS transporter [Bacillus licheniformis]